VAYQSFSVCNLDGLEARKIRHMARHLCSVWTKITPSPLKSVIRAVLKITHKQRLNGEGDSRGCRRAQRVQRCSCDLDLTLLGWQSLTAGLSKEMFMPSPKILNVSVTAEFIGRRPSSGRFASASKVVRAELRLFQNAEHADYSSSPLAQQRA